jgi:hypothetical protein
MGGIVREQGGIPIKINGPADHVHLLISLPSKISLAEMMCVVKTNSSRWAHELASEYHDFGWQTGYAAFSLDKSELDRIASYITRQEEHHRKKDFQSEYRHLLTTRGIQYDERYLWD